MKLPSWFFWSLSLLLFPSLFSLSGDPTLNGAPPASTDEMMVVEGKVSVATEDAVMVSFNGQMELYSIDADTVIRKDDLMAQPMDLGKDDLVRVTAIRTPRDWIATNIEAWSFK